jgi:ribosomal-protein-alanine N-acetyltransferase
MISTSRLDLVPLGQDALSLIRRGEASGVERLLGCSVPPGWMESIPAAERLAQLEADPAEEPWLVRAMVLRGTGRIVGQAGFHDPPDEDGTVEIGYEVVPRHRRRGYASEAVRALMGWALETGRATRCRACVGPANAASRALLDTLGFERVGHRIDAVDGLELVLVRPLEDEPAPPG